MVSNLFFLLRDSENDLLLQFVGNSTAIKIFWLHFARCHAYRSWWQCRSKGNISGGARERRRREPLGGFGGMLPQKILKSRGLEMLFPAFSKRYLWFTYIANYLLRTLSQQTNAHWEYNTCNVNYKIENRLSLYLETSKCFTFQSHHSKFVVIKLSELP